MSTHASAGKQWTEKELDHLTVEGVFRLRGAESTRLDTFIDAAFAFVLTLLVISFDDIPSNFPEMLTAVKRIPGFAASFAILMWFWLQHRLWSRWYGLENPRTILLSLIFIFAMLVFVYPLRMLFEGLFSSITGGYLSTTYTIETYFEIRMIFVFYSVGFLAMSIIVSQLFLAAMHSSSSLALNPIELQETKNRMQAWAIAATFGILSILLALFLPVRWVEAAGHIYFALIPAMFVPRYLARRHSTNKEAEKK